MKDYFTSAFIILGTPLYININAFNLATCFVDCIVRTGLRAIAIGDEHALETL